uniref:Circadian input-output histidine kinase CikA n=2 Tax=Gloeothece TaxID=28070 RepID=E0ULK6_GLOV7|nr:multi-sensor hybrid histidine kinase [Gloeothece verrucosa PCC 7822]
MGGLMQAYDWSQTSLGSVEKWPQSLKTAVRIMLTSRQAMFVWWGEELINLYNDAYKAIVGGKHPLALGQPASSVWREIWDQVGPRAASALLNNEGTYDEALLLIMERNGYSEETYYTFSYSPVPNDEGGTGGIICANTDDTGRIIGERQLALLRELAARTADARTFDEACRVSAKCLESNPYDLPFAMIYLIDREKHEVVLAGTCGIDIDNVAAPPKVALQSDSVWPFKKVITENKACLVSNLESFFENLPSGAWQRTPHQAVVVPIASSGQTGKAGLLVVGLNPFRLFDDDYRRFIDLVAAQISASIANAQAYEEERKRAEALAELDRAKTVFFSNVSHEFRTPLTLMLGPIEDVLTDKDEPLGPSQQERIEIVQRNGLRLLKLVNTLLDFSRIEAGRVEAVYEATDLSVFTTELASVFRSTIERAGMRLMVNCPPLPEPVYVDREMWEKIVLNLLSNAFKFTLNGEISVSLEWVKHSVKLSVNDTGIGIPEAEIPLLFERFHRVKGAQGRSFEGSGIGLSLVQELVKLHQGSIDVVSVEGLGTCFTIFIPTGTAHLPQERISTTRTLTSTATGATTFLEEASRWLPPQEETETETEKKEIFSASPLPLLSYSLKKLRTPLSLLNRSRILIADDNADMRDYLKRLLSQQYEVEAVVDGLTALKAIHSCHPDLVLTDVMMPGLDGFELLKSLRADLSTQHIPIILLSARAGEESRVEGLEAGADDYLIKPFSARELLARVEATLKLSYLRQEATRREQGLRAQAQAARVRLENVLAQINEQFIVLDQQWRYSFINDQVIQVTGKSNEELLGHNIWDLFPDLVNSPFYTECHRAVAEQTVVQVEFFYWPWQRWFENRIYPFAEGVTILVSDISARKQAEKELRESEERFRQMADNAPVMVWVTDPTGYCTYLSKSWYEFSGQNEETGLGFGWLDAVHPEDSEDSRNIFLAANKCQEAFRLEYRLRRFDGEYRWALDVGSPWFGLEGEFKGYIGSVIDISERKAAEVERDRLLQREQAARTEAEKANRIKDEFLAVLSHELRSPLNPILGWAKLLQTKKLDGATFKQALSTIERNAQLQAQLIEDLLDVSRILQGKISLNPIPVNLASIIRHSIETVYLAANAKSIDIQTTLDETVGQILGDPARLQQIVWNLLSNAVKFTSTGGRVEVLLESVGQSAQITVSDTGKGITSEFLPYVFDYFRQADSTTTRKFGGLGLGLAIVRHLVELHGGTVGAESPGENQGATFWVKFPLITSSFTKEDENVSISNIKETVLPLADLEILVVDDDEDTRYFLAFALQQSGATVTTVGSASEALQVLVRSAPNVIVSDVGMPDMDGYMLIQQIRMLEAQQGREKIKAIALTAYAGEIDRQQALREGFQRHIIKPINPSVLIKTIVELSQQVLLE